MKKIITIVFLFVGCLFIISLPACKSEKEKKFDALQSNLKTFFVANGMDSSSIIDSFKLIKVDTISQFILLDEQYKAIEKQQEKVISLFKTSNKLLSYDIDQIRLYKIIGSEGLATIAKKDVKDQDGKGKLMKVELDTLGKVLAVIADKIKASDTIKPVGFQAKCFYQVRQKDKSVKRDVAYIFLNINRDIVKREDFLQLPYKVDFEKL